MTFTLLRYSFCQCLQKTQVMTTIPKPFKDPFKLQAVHIYFPILSDNLRVKIYAKELTPKMVEMVDIHCVGCVSHHTTVNRAQRAYYF